MKDIMKAIKSLEKGRILLRGTTRKITSPVGYLSFLMTTGLSLMKMYSHH